MTAWTRRLIIFALRGFTMTDLRPLAMFVMKRAKGGGLAKLTEDQYYALEALGYIQYVNFELGFVLTDTGWAALVQYLRSDSHVD